MVEINGSDLMKFALSQGWICKKDLENQTNSLNVASNLQQNAKVLVKTPHIGTMRL